MGFFGKKEISPLLNSIAYTYSISILVLQRDIVDPRKKIDINISDEKYPKLFRQWYNENKNIISYTYFKMQFSEESNKLNNNTSRRYSNQDVSDRDRDSIIKVLIQDFTGYYSKNGDLRKLIKNKLNKLNKNNALNEYFTNLDCHFNKIGEALEALKSKNLNDSYNRNGDFYKYEKVLEEFLINVFDLDLL